MPIKIMEMIVKANVCDSSNTHRGANDSSGSNNSVDSNREVLIQQAVEQVLDILRQERER